MRRYFRLIGFQNSYKKYFCNDFKKSSKEIKKEFSSNTQKDTSTIKHLMESLKSNLKIIGNMVSDKLSPISHKLGLKRDKKDLNYKNLGSIFNSL